MTRSLLVLGLAALILAGCAIRPNTGGEPLNRRDIPPGPGLFTGKAGAFVIERRE